ncbi:MAG: histidinol-phosphatase, partial [Caulobacter sp. 12-67-6]
MTLSAERLAALDAFIIDLNRASAEVILPLFRADHGLEDKGAGKNLPRDSHAAFDPVTEADRGAEAAIRTLISEH